MILHWIMHPYSSSLKPGQWFTFEYKGRILEAYPIESQSSMALCVCAEHLESRFIKDISLTGNPWPRCFNEQFIIIGENVFYQGIHWAPSIRPDQMIIFEAPSTHPFGYIPSTFLHMGSVLLPHEIAALSFLENKGVASRIIDISKIGCIYSLNDFISRFETKRYVQIHH
ncbi:hypothetical protein EBS02_01750 [bacterium]|nr:hypothetical protein [bacterium]NBX72534.1 hypothetical protein [bacterium]